MLTEKAPEESRLDPLRNTTMIRADWLPKYRVTEDIITSLEGLGTIARHHDLPVFFTNGIADPVQEKPCTVYLLWFNGLRLYSSSDPIDPTKEKEKKEVQ